MREPKKTVIATLAVMLGLLSLAACAPQMTNAPVAGTPSPSTPSPSTPSPPNVVSQIPSTISCPSGHGYWDVLSVMMMDPSLASGYHMEGITNGLPSAYIYTVWDQSNTKVYYVKNPKGNPWDINLYDQNYIYQWVTELDDLNGVNHWNDPTSCRKFNNGSQSSTADLSMRWAARCAAPGGDNSSFWNPPPPAQSSNTNYYTYVDQILQPSPQNLDYSQLEVEPTGTMTITDHRATPAQSCSVTTLPLQYTYSCSVSQNVNSCKFREVFDYGLDTDVNPVDNVKHSYGWVSWRYYTNSTGGNPDVAANWVLANSSTSDQLMSGQVTPNFQCF
jgi:hypothetical protein